MESICLAFPSAARVQHRTDSAPIPIVRFLLFLPSRRTRPLRFVPFTTLILRMLPPVAGTSAIMLRSDVDSCQRKCRVVPVILVALESTHVNMRSLAVHFTSAARTARPKSVSILALAMEALTVVRTIHRESVAAPLHFVPNFLPLTADLFVFPARMVEHHAQSCADAVPCPLTMATVPCVVHPLVLLLTRCVTQA